MKKKKSVRVPGDQDRQNDGGIPCVVRASSGGTREHGVLAAEEAKMVIRESFDERSFLSRTFQESWHETRTVEGIYHG